MKVRYLISALLLTVVLATAAFSAPPDTSSKVTITTISGQNLKVIGLPFDSLKVTVGSTTKIMTKADSTGKVVTAPHKIIAYYFHGNVRCASCRKIEAYTRQAIDSGFVKALADGRLEWRVINIDSSQNEHFILDYQLYTKSVIVSELADGKEKRWKNLEKVWTLLGNQDDFRKYIQDEVKAYLDSN